MRDARRTIALLVCLAAVFALAAPARAQWSEADLAAEAAQIAASCPGLPATPERALALPAAQQAKAVRCVLGASAAFMTPRLPKTMAEGVTLIAIEAKGTTVVHRYRLERNSMSESERVRAAERAKSVICDGGGRALVVLGAAYGVVWTGADGRPLGETLVSRC